MSKTFYFDLNPQKVNFSLNYLQNLIQKELGTCHILKLKLFEKEFGGRFYIDKESSRGVEVFLFERKQFVMKLNILSNEADYLVCKKMLAVLVKNLTLKFIQRMMRLFLKQKVALKNIFCQKKFCTSG